MHIPDGILPAEVAIGGYVVTAAITWVSLRQIQKDPDFESKIPKAALLTAAFFAASWIHIPLPPTSVHLVLNGLLGVVLGWFAFPSILVGLFLQAVMFQHGGLTSLGVNAAMMGIPALIAYGVYGTHTRLNLHQPLWVSVFAFVGGAVGLGLAAGIAFTILIATIPAYMDANAERAAISALTLAHLPLAVIEGVFTALIIAFLRRVRPELVSADAVTP